MNALNNTLTCTTLTMPIRSQTHQEKYNIHNFHDFAFVNASKLLCLLFVLSHKFDLKKFCSMLIYKYEQGHVTNAISSS